MVFKVGEKFDTVEKLHTEILDVSPSILIPHYDEDSSTLFLTSKVSNWLINIGFSHRVCNSFSKNESTLHSGWKWLKMSYFFLGWKHRGNLWSIPGVSPLIRLVTLPPLGPSHRPFIFAQKYLGRETGGICSGFPTDQYDHRTHFFYCTSCQDWIFPIGSFPLDSCALDSYFNRSRMASRKCQVSLLSTLISIFNLKWSLDGWRLFRKNEFVWI